MKDLQKIDLIVTRHRALVAHLHECGVNPLTPVIEHATPEQLRGKHVAGVLPLSLACHCASVTEVPLAVTPEMRGRELDLETVRSIAGAPVTYTVEVQND